jgi:hypothetical protein
MNEAKKPACPTCNHALEMPLLTQDGSRVLVMADSVKKSKRTQFRVVSDDPEAELREGD